MSFTTTVKNEISILKTINSEKIAELSGFFRSNYNYENNKIELYTENIKICKRVNHLIKDIFNIDSPIESKKNIIFNKKLIYYIIIEKDIEKILKKLSVIKELGILKDYPESFETPEEYKSYIRGAFLSCGSINDPKTSQYHLEFLFDSKEESIYVQRLLNEFDLNAKILLREKKYMVYIKDSDDISDFLKLIGASNAVIYYENVRTLKEQINITNRLNNCEQANIEKTLLSSNEIIADINLIIEKLGLDFLDEKLQEAINYRLKYPEMSLNELSEVISIETGKNITKSGLNHRFRKIKEIASKLK